MSTQTSAPPWRVTWRVNPMRPTLTQYSLTVPSAPGEKPPRRRWVDHAEFPTAYDAELSARANGLSQYVPRGVTHQNAP